jgi:hypothetical protein
LNGLIGVCNCWFPHLLWISIPKTTPLTSHALAPAISAALSSALTATLSAAARSHAFADWPLAKRPCSIVHWCHMIFPFKLIKRVPCQIKTPAI